MGSDDRFNAVAAIVMLVIVAGMIAGCASQPYFEARAFNKFTKGPKATYWDAAWTELRVTPQ